MIYEKEKMGLKSLYIILEDINDIKKAKRFYDKISYYSYDRAELEGFEVRSKKTPLIVLDVEKEEIFKKFNATTRKKIKRFERDETLKVVLNDDSYSEAYKIYKKHVYAYGGVPESKELMKKFVLHSVYENNRLIVCFYCIDSKPYIRAIAINSLRLEKIDKVLMKKISNSTCALVWALVEYAKKNDYKSFDLGSINMADESRKGARDFKMGFAPIVVDEYYHTYKNIRFRFFERFVGLKLFLFRLLSKLLKNVK